MDHCLIADPLPASAQGFFLECNDYRPMVRFEAAMLRSHTDQDAQQMLQSTMMWMFGPPSKKNPHAAFDALLWFYRCGRPAPTEMGSGPRPPLAFDYIIDGPLIAAAFQSAYGLDLTDPCTTIHWWRFQALLQGLPDECRFCRVIGWRTADLSGLKGKQLAFYSDMKRKFALPADLGGEKQVYATKAEWDAAFIQRLRRQAGKK